MVKEDLKKALNLFQRGANHQNLKAYNWLSRAYIDGIGVKQNKNLAFAWFLKLANQGHIHHQNIIGYIIFMALAISAR
ncbi:tetratricopeptide repeat protein [Bartonella sp. HY761]|uniref:tetratricopeptide repeat protein n=1 Tax=Bartonella sp. HY761 TaxID=2979330 RepID=UPI0021E1F8DC|nr:hypothetical protein [Bartonella sp. HY761]UXN07931.1 hypothetical protein N6A79_15085 [Bartonella sp. HY761]